MNILLLGSGGREHALAWKIAQSKKVDNLYIAPGNGGTGNVGYNVAIKADDFDGIKNFPAGIFASVAYVSEFHNLSGDGGSAVTECIDNGVFRPTAFFADVSGVVRFCNFVQNGLVAESQGVFQFGQCSPFVIGTGIFDGVMNLFKAFSVIVAESENFGFCGLAPK